MRLPDPQQSNNEGLPLLSELFEESHPNPQPDNPSCFPNKDSHSHCSNHLSQYSSMPGSWLSQNSSIPSSDFLCSPLEGFKPNITIPSYPALEEKKKENCKAQKMKKPKKEKKCDKKTVMAEGKRKKLERNRESAKESRKRRKQYVENLEEEVLDSQ